MGEVKAPGIYPLMGRHDVLDLISVAGGLTSFASKMVTINHKDSPDQVVAIDLSAPPKDLAGADVTIQPGDRIVVMRAGIVYVIGDVGRPGGYLMGPHDALTALQALSLAQGINKTAKSNASLIRNGPNGRTEADLPLKKILANQIPDPPLHDGDILFVPVSGAKNWGEKSMTAILQMAVGVVIYGRL
jgi:polysaccharide export outer membrane protein